MNLTRLNLSHCNLLNATYPMHFIQCNLLNTIYPNAAKITPTKLNSTKLNSTKPNSTKPNSTKPNLTQANSTQLTPTQPQAPPAHNHKNKKGGQSHGNTPRSCLR